MFELHGCAFSPLFFNTQKISETLLQTRLIASAESTLTSVMPDFTCCYIFSIVKKKEKRAKFSNSDHVCYGYNNHSIEGNITARYGKVCFLNFLNSTMCFFPLFPWAYTDCKSSGAAHSRLYHTQCYVHVFLQ